MIATWAAQVLVAAAAATTPDPCGQPTPVVRSGATFATGWPTPAPAPAPSAMRLNEEAAALYKQRRYDEASELYAAADKADPHFLAPRLNLASLFVRQDRFDEAARALRGLLFDGFVPWHQQAREATDLAALWASQGQRLADDVAAARARWGAELARGILIVSRLRAPVRVAPQDGPSPLFPQQELVAWNPASRRFHQATATQGRVLAFVQERAGGPVIFLTATKVWRVAGKLSHFEGVRVHRLMLPSMEVASASIDGGVARVDAGFDKQGRATLEVTRPGLSRASASFTFTDQLRETPAQRMALKDRVTLTTGGVDPVKTHRASPACGFAAADDFTQSPPALRIRPRRGAAFSVSSQYGVGLRGLPLSALEPR